MPQADANALHHQITAFKTIGQHGHQSQSRRRGQFPTGQIRT